MSRLDSFIARMQAQRDCLNFLKPAVEALPGPILEVGLGNGRTYDHLRDLFPDREIYVFERKVAAHPDCIPPGDRLFLGEARDALPRAALKLGATAALIHTDLGTGDHAANMAMAAWLGPALDALAHLGVDDLDVTTDAKGQAQVSAGKYLNKRTYIELQQGASNSSKAIINLDVGRGIKLRGAAGSNGAGEAGIVYEHEY